MMFLFNCVIFRVHMLIFRVVGFQKSSCSILRNRILGLNMLNSVKFIMNGTQMVYITYAFIP